MKDWQPQTIRENFAKAAKAFSDRPLLVVPPDPARSYHPGGYEASFGAVHADMMRVAGALRVAGYGHGHRIAALMGNQPEILILKLACAELGISWVPVNPDYRANETAYLLQDSGALLFLVMPGYEDQARAAVAELGQGVPVAMLDVTAPVFPKATKPAPLDGPVTPDTESSLLYTSGTTGRPKGCMLSQDYEWSMGAWYAAAGGVLQFAPEGERIYCPLPLFHTNAAVLAFLCFIATGSCLIMPERFSASRWWSDIRTTGATAAHYLGIVIPALMNRPETPEDRDHGLKWAVGAGVEPTLHRAFEERFGTPLVEVWGMTEMCRFLGDTHEPRLIDTRAMGRGVPGLEVRVVDDQDRDVPHGQPGEMLVRHSTETPQKGAFSGYLNLPEATEEAWRGGWFHTGDTVTMDESGMVYFMDRAKNIIRRSGENIAAAEIESCLQQHPAVARVAVLAAPDEMRDEEVLAAVQLMDAKADAATAEALFAYAFSQLTYYKAPGWVVFVEEVPVTGTQKVQKHNMFDKDKKPWDIPGAFDFRHRKKRTAPT